MLFTANSIIIKPLAQQSIVWFKASNTYVLLAPEIAKLLVKMSEGLSQKELKFWCRKNLELSIVETDTLLDSVSGLIKKLNQPKLPLQNSKKTTSKSVPKYDSVKYYQIDTQIIKASFETDALAFLVHPKFAHLSVNSKEFDFEFDVYLNDNVIFLEVDKSVIGTWRKTEIEYFQGKFSMCLIEKLYQKPETDWMGVFHASALSDGKNCVLFTGDSGNGKSTLAALLMAKDFSLLADDFVPVLAINQQVYYFSAAISIKESAVLALSEYFPQLNKTTQHHFKNLNKRVRYLAPSPNQKNQIEHLPCKALVFVKYDQKVDLKCEKITQELAFQQLIPDAWLSPETNNAQQFLDWFVTMACYQLTYSDNTLMYQTVRKFFNDDL